MIDDLSIDTVPPEACGGPPVIESLIKLANRAAFGGCFVEVGVYKGGTAWHLARIARWRNVNLHLFDTFSGIPERGQFDFQHKIGDFGDTTLEQVKTAIPDAIYHVGYFPSTMPQDWSDPISFLHVDCDQYTPIMACIEYLLPHVIEGGIVLFDDYDTTSGCQKAVNENFTHFRRTKQGKAFIIKGDT